MPEIRLDGHDATATVTTLCNPGKLNALDVAMWPALQELDCHGMKACAA